MRIAKPILLVTTPVGVVWGLYEAWRLAGGLVFLMAAMVGVIGAAFALLVHTYRREKREQEARDAQVRSTTAGAAETPGRNAGS